MNRHLSIAACAFVLAAASDTASAAVTEARVERLDATRVRVSWTASAPVDVYVSDRPNADRRTATLLSRRDRDGRHVAVVSDRSRSYFLLRDTLDGGEVHVAERLVPLERGSNFRDVGAYPAAEGKHVRWGLIYRSGATPFISEHDIQYLRSLGLRAMIDLRSTEERELAPTRLTGRNVRYVALDYSFSALLPKDAPANGYRDWLTLLAPQYRAIFAEMLVGKGALVYNCTAGQDRTGIATALILAVLGVPREIILQDYHLSTMYRRPEHEMPPVDPVKHPDNFVVELWSKARGVKPVPLYGRDGRPLLADTFDEIETRWGSVERYLDQVLGIDLTNVATLRANYLH